MRFKKFFARFARQKKLIRNIDFSDLVRIHMVEPHKKCLKNLCSHHEEHVKKALTTKYQLVQLGVGREPMAVFVRFLQFLGDFRKGFAQSLAIIAKKSWKSMY